MLYAQGNGESTWKQVNDIRDDLYLNEILNLNFWGARWSGDTFQ